MSIEVTDLIGLAQQLSAGNSECEWRSGASRAYYAAYHKALLVADRCLPPSPYVSGEHQRLTDRYIAEGKKGKALAYMLIDLKKKSERLLTTISRIHLISTMQLIFLQIAQLSCRKWMHLRHR